jgi:transposase
MVRFEEAAAQTTLSYMLVELSELEERIKSLDNELEALANSDRYREVVGWVRCFRGFKTISAMIVVTELFSFFRFRSPRHLMSYLGIVPSEYSSGGSHCRGGITRAGNSYLRRILIEAAWHYRHIPRVTPTIAKRREGQPQWAIEVAERAQLRLHRRYRHLALSRRKNRNKVNVALARELTGFLWAVLHRGLVEKAQKTESRAA